MIKPREEPTIVVIKRKENTDNGGVKRLEIIKGTKLNQDNT